MPESFELLWLVVLIVFIVLEASTVNLISIWFALGALAALFSSFFSSSIIVQIIVFVAVSAITLAASRPFVKKVLLKRQEKTNFDRIIGMTGIVTENIDNIKGTGYISVDGKDWMARSEDGQNIPADSKVKVVSIQGARVFVVKE